MVSYLLMFLAILLIVVILTSLVMVLLFLVVAIHELSHAVAAQLLGLGLLQIRIAFLTLIPSESGWRWHWAWRRGEMDGIVQVQQGMRIGRPYALMILAGPLGNLGTAILVGLLALLPLPYYAITILFTFAGLNLLYTVVNLIPHRMKHLHSDGSQLLQMYLRRRR